MSRVSRRRVSRRRVSRRSVSRRRVSRKRSLRGGDVPFNNEYLNIVDGGGGRDTQTQTQTTKHSTNFFEAYEQSDIHQIISSILSNPSQKFGFSQEDGQYVTPLLTKIQTTYTQATQDRVDYNMAAFFNAVYDFLSKVNIKKSDNSSLINTLRMVLTQPRIKMK